MYRIQHYVYYITGAVKFELDKVACENMRSSETQTNLVFSETVGVA